MCKVLKLSVSKWARNIKSNLWTSSWDTLYSQAYIKKLAVMSFFVPLIEASSIANIWILSINHMIVLVHVFNLLFNKWMVHY